MYHPTDTAVPVAVDYRPISELPPALTTVETARRQRRRNFASLLIVLLFIGGAIAYFTIDGTDQAKNQADHARQELDGVKLPHWPLNAVLLAAGVVLLLAGKRLYTVAFFGAGFLAGGFLTFLLWTSAAVHVSALSHLSGTTQGWIGLAVAAVAGTLLGLSIARLERLGTAVMASVAGYAGGYALYPITLDHLISWSGGQIATATVCAALAFVVVFALEKGLVVVTTCAAGAFLAAVGGAELIFHWGPTSEDAAISAIKAGDVRYWYFVAATAGLFLLGLLAQLVVDPRLIKRRAPEEDLTFYGDHDQGGVEVRTDAGARFI